MFCGTCLQNRYGQDARVALKDPNWSCPPCLKVCNCSLCRARTGKRSIPDATQHAKEKGFQSVHHYLKFKHALKSKKQKNGDIKKDSSEAEEVKKSPEKSENTDKTEEVIELDTSFESSESKKSKMEKKVEPEIKDEKPEMKTMVKPEVKGEVKKYFCKRCGNWYDTEMARDLFHECKPQEIDPDSEDDNIVINLI